jgi:hypothetical protein
MRGLDPRIQFTISVQDDLDGRIKSGHEDGF